MFFVTNNSTKTRTEYAAKLADTAGIAASASDILSSAYAAAVALKAAGVNKAVYCIGQAGLVEELTTVAGVRVVGPADWGKEFSFGTLDPAGLDPDVQAVVIGFDNR